MLFDKEYIISGFAIEIELESDEGYRSEWQFKGQKGQRSMGVQSAQSRNYRTYDSVTWTNKLQEK